MAKRKEHEYKVRVTYTEGCEKRLVEALLDIYYSDPETVAQIAKKAEEKSVMLAGG